MRRRFKFSKRILDVATLPDGAKIVAWLREGADEIETAHAILDINGVPRSVPGSEPVECTLAARIALALDGVRS